MSNIKTRTIITAAAATLFAASAFASTAFAAPAAGNAPYFDDAMVSSQLQRSEVEAQAAANMPAAGEFSAHADGANAGSTLSRAEVQANIGSMPLAGNNA